eukprot:1755687-Rhodomonas_salina.1
MRRTKNRFAETGSRIRASVTRSDREAAFISGPRNQTHESSFSGVALSRSFQVGCGLVPTSRVLTLPAIRNQTHAPPFPDSSDQRGCLLSWDSGMRTA